MVVINPDYKLAAIFLALGALLDTIPYLQLLPGPFVTLLGVLFAVQATRIRFTFDREAFELKIGDDLEGSGENIVVGGENRWNYDSFVNWEFFPEGWIDQPQGPILVYFKETQTPKEFWNVGPGEQANSEEALAKGEIGFSSFVIKPWYQQLGSQPISPGVIRAGAPRHETEGDSDGHAAQLDPQRAD